MPVAHVRVFRDDKYYTAEIAIPDDDCAGTTFWCTPEGARWMARDWIACMYHDRPDYLATLTVEDGETTEPSEPANHPCECQRGTLRRRVLRLARLSR